MIYDLRFTIYALVRGGTCRSFLSLAPGFSPGSVAPVATSGFSGFALGEKPLKRLSFFRRPHPGLKHGAKLRVFI